MDRSEVSRVDILQYIQKMLINLRDMARSADCTMLAYIIEMAHMEASDAIKAERESK